MAKIFLRYGYDMASGSAVLSKPRKTMQRFSRVANAADTIDGFSPELDVSFALTLGQFSLLDLIEAVLDLVGVADVVICTWSVGFYDLDAAERFRDLGKLRSCRFIMDSSGKRGQATGADVASVFGDHAIRTTRTHAKFVLIDGDRWSCVITTSMNLNLNPRSEQFAITSCPGTVAFVRSIVAALWDELPAGATDDRKPPMLEKVESVASKVRIECTPCKVVKTGVYVDAR